MCHICGLKQGEIEVKSERGQAVYICSNCSQKGGNS